MTQQEILASNTTKTAKIKALIDLGLTRSQIAELMGIGYGFVQNVYAKHVGVSRTNNRSTIQQAVFRVLPFTRKFGVEIEAFFKSSRGIDKLKNLLQQQGVAIGNGDRSAQMGVWKVTSDSSIRANGGRAFELVSPILEGQAGLEELAKVCQALKECGARINKSCGLHIHFDAEGFDVQTWKNLLINYAKIEDAIDAFMPTSRRANNNTYCQSMKGHEASLQSATTVERVISLMGSSRYKKVNVHSYARHKTVEFRQHSGSVEFEKIKNWILFLHNLVVVSAHRILTETTLESLSDFNQADIIAFYSERTEELSNQ